MDENGSVMIRPLLCAPDLVCTGDVEPVPNTCVKRRPANTCYQVCIGALKGLGSDLGSGLGSGLGFGATR